MAAAYDNIILVNTVNTIFGINNKLRRSSDIININLIMICGLGEEYRASDTNNNYFDLDNYNSLDILAALIKTYNQGQDQKNSMKKSKQILKKQIKKEK